MGFLSWLFGGGASATPAPAAEDQKAVDFSAEMWAALNGGWGVPTKSGVDVSISTALQNPAFFRGVMVIADGVAQLPVQIYRSLPSGKGSEPAIDHPLYDMLFYRPSELQDAFQFFSTILMHAAATGNSVSYRVVVNGETRELIPVRPENTEIDVLSPFMRRQFNISFETGVSAVVNDADVFYLTGPNWRPFKGIDPSLVGREAIGLARATEESQARLHSNGVRPSGMFAPEGGRTLTPEQVQLLRAQIQETYSGLQNAMKPIVASGQMKYQQFTMTGVDAQHLETRKHQIEEICRILGVFPIMVGHAGDQSPTFASAEAFFDAHVRYTLQRWIKALKTAIETQLLTKDERREGYHVRIDTSELTRGSLEARTHYYQTALGTNSNPGWLTPNEIRDDDGWNPVDRPEMDEVWQPATMAPNGRKPGDQAPQEQTADQTGGEKAMTPRTLYVSRKLLNAKDFLAWAKAQGFKTTTPADELHVTIAYSKAKIDWMLAGDDVFNEEELIVPAGGPRAVEKLGDKGAVVLMFSSSRLAWRHHEIREAGATWDFPEYQPHVTVTYDGGDVDLSKIVPYRGELRFGPEIFAEVDENWTPKES
jgi:HK97 family phage portal protein